MRSTFIEESGTIYAGTEIIQFKLQRITVSVVVMDIISSPAKYRVWGLDLSTYKFLVNAYEVCISYVYSWGGGGGGGQCFVQIITRLY